MRARIDISDIFSPNYNSRDGQDIDMLVLHYTGMTSGQAALEKLCDPKSNVSSHYLIDEDGGVSRLVPEAMRAWHAGKACWRGSNNINQRSIGIEIVNPGHEFGYRPFPEAQMQSVGMLCADILSRYAIEPRHVVGHSDVAPMRKEDPGELFDWPWLASHGIGLFPPAPLFPGESEKMLPLYGYEMTSPSKSILAFQRHFRPNNLSGQWDNECAGLLAALLKMV